MTISSSSSTITIMTFVAILSIINYVNAFQPIVRKASTTSSSSLSLSSSYSLLALRRHNHVYQQRFQSSIATSLRSTSTRLYSDNNSDDDNDKNNNKARVLFLGTPDVAATSLKRIVEESQKDDSSFQVVGVVTQPPKRRKRKGKEIPSPVGLIAQELDIPVLWPEKAKDPDFLNELETTYKPDLCITAAYGQYLPKRFLSLPKFGTLNIHPSLLPRWRGASPVQRSLEAGDNPVGVSVLFTVSKMDAGPIVSQAEEMINENDDATFLLPHLFDIGTESLLEAIPDVVSGKITMEEGAIQQDEELVVNAAMISSSEGELRVWRESARVCHNKVRGFSMWPGTFLYFFIGDDDGESADADADSATEPVKVKIIKSRVLHDAAGSVELTKDVELGPNKKSGLHLVCGDGSVLELLQVQPVTRKAMDAKSFVNGLRGKKLKWVEMPEEPENE